MVVAEAARVAVVAVAVIQAVVVAARAAAVAQIAAVPAAAAVAAIARVVVAAAGAAVVAAAAVDKVVATKTATVNLGIVPVTAARGIRVATAIVVVVARIRIAREIASSFVTRIYPGTVIAIGIEIGIEIATEIVTVAVIEIVIATAIVIATEIGIASTKALAFTIRRIMVGTGTAPTLMSRATETAYSRAPTMAGEGRTMNLSALTSLRVGLPADSSHCSLTEVTDKRIATALCAAIKRAIKTGSGTLMATAFTPSQQL